MERRTRIYFKGSGWLIAAVKDKLQLDFGSRRAFEELFAIGARLLRDKKIVLQKYDFKKPMKDRGGVTGYNQIDCLVTPTVKRVYRNAFYDFYGHEKSMTEGFNDFLYGYWKGDITIIINNDEEQ